MLHLQPAPLLAAQKIEAVAVFPQYPESSGYVKVRPQVVTHVRVVLSHCCHPVLPFCDSGFMSTAITRLILDLHEIKLRTCEMQTGAKQL